MAIIIGLVVVLGCVFGVYIAVGGNIEIIMHAAPHELATILGASIGALIIANRGHILKGILRGFGKAFKGPQFKKQDYIDLLCLMFTLVKLAKSKGLIALEPHIEKPVESDIFQKYPKILHDHFACDYICDTFRMITMSLEDPYQVEDAMQKQLDKHHHETLHPAHSLQTMADGLPAIGIVAAVLGVIKTMASISSPVEVLGAMIGGALVGTFLGVFLSYCLVGPIASRLSEILEEEAQYYYIIRDIMVGYLHGQAVQIAVEVGRGNVPSLMQPTFFELEEAITVATS
jgi:chemotaxis protein MotA